MKKILSSLNLSNCSFAIIENDSKSLNVDAIATTSLYTSIKKQKGVLVPIIVSEASLSYFDKMKLVDVRDRHVLTRKERGLYLVVVDGKCRLLSCLLINNSAVDNTEMQNSIIESIPVIYCDAEGIDVMISDS